MDVKNILLDKYTVYPYEIKIIEADNKIYYYPKLLIKEDLELKFLIGYIVRDIVASFIKKNDLLEEIECLSLRKIMNIVENVYDSIVNELRMKKSNIFSNEIIEKIKPYTLLKVLKLSFLSVFLLDELIMEIYIDEDPGILYIDHENWGRCEFPFKIDRKKIERIKHLVEVESGELLTEDNPSLKIDLSTKFFKVRITIDGYPLSNNGIHIDIRKFKNSPITIFDLIRVGTISAEIAAFLIIAVLHRINIVIVGRVGTGKTTLANALDMLTPATWRKIYLEQINESLDLTHLGHKQVKYKIGKQFSYFIESVNLLHKNPDYIFFGEILTKDQSESLFHALLAGLTGIETFHADSAEDAIRRWIFYHGIPVEVVAKAGIIINMIKIRDILGRVKFRVKEITEVRYCPNSRNIELKTLFSWDSKNDKYILNFSSLEEVETIKRNTIRAHKNIDHLYMKVLNLINNHLRDEHYEISNFLSNLIELFKSRDENYVIKKNVQQTI